MRKQRRSPRWPQPLQKPRQKQSSGLPLFYPSYSSKNLLYLKMQVLYRMESAQHVESISVTPKAAEKVAEFMKQEGNTGLFLRVYVTGGGCSGLSYGMGF